MSLPLSVVLVSSRNPLNIGAAARAMSNFGLSDLRLVNPYDVAFREAVSATHAAETLRTARVFPSVAEAVADCSLVVGTTASSHRIPEHPVRRLELGGLWFRFERLQSLRHRHLEVGPPQLLHGAVVGDAVKPSAEGCRFLELARLSNRHLSLSRQKPFGT